MSTLLIRLVGPMQAWGTTSRFSVRETDRQPSKSGIVGLLAAAQGRRRTDPIEDLASLRIAVRSDQPGRIMRDFQTARTLDGTTSLPLSQRYFLEDAVFVIGIEGETQQIEQLAAAVQSPHFPVFLGRKSCSPTAPLFIEISELPLLDAITSVQWQATKQYQKRASFPVRLEILADAENEVDGYAQDFPISFDPENRQYRTRPIQRFEVLVQNPTELIAVGPNTHDPFKGMA